MASDEDFNASVLADIISPRDSGLELGGHCYLSSGADSSQAGTVEQYVQCAQSPMYLAESTAPSRISFYSNIVQRVLELAGAPIKNVTGIAVIEFRFVKQNVLVMPAN